MFNNVRKKSRRRLRVHVTWQRFLLHRLGAMRVVVLWPHSASRFRCWQRSQYSRWIARGPHSPDARLQAAQQFAAAPRGVV